MLLRLSTILACYAASIHHCFAFSTRGLQQKDKCNEENSMESYFLLDMKGPPRDDVNERDLQGLETGFMEAYNSLASCDDASYRMIDQVSILQDAGDDISYGDTFSYLLRAQGKCRGSSLRGDRRSLEERQDISLNDFSTKHKGSLR